MELIVSGWGRDHGEKVLARRDLTQARRSSGGGYTRPDAYLTLASTKEAGPFGEARIVPNGNIELRFYAKIVLNGEYLVRQTISRKEIAKLFLSQYYDCSFEELLDVLNEIKESRPKRHFPPVMLKPINDIGLSEKSEIWLLENNIWYVGDLVQKTEAEMRGLPDFDNQTFHDIRENLTPLGLQFGMEVQGWPAVPIPLLKKVDDLELSPRSANCLRNAGIDYVGDLVQKTDADLLRTPDFGRKSTKEIQEVLRQLGLRLGMKIQNWRPSDIDDLSRRFADI